MKTITLTNSFHNTEIAVRLTDAELLDADRHAGGRHGRDLTQREVWEWLREVEPRRAARVRRALCVPGCTCGVVR